MSLVLAAALAASTATLPQCSWDRPGHNPFMGNVVAAVDRYTDIPKDVRDRLKARMAKRQYDEIAAITRDQIAGKRQYGNLRDMHFGQGQVCRSVTRSAWVPQAVERGLVYCESEHCIIVPTVCRNVSRVTRLPEQRADAAQAEPGSTGAAGSGTSAGGPVAAQPTDSVQAQSSESAGSFAEGMNPPGAVGGGSSSGWTGGGSGAGNGGGAFSGVSFASLSGGGGGGGGGSFGGRESLGGKGPVREATGSLGGDRSPRPLPPETGVPKVPSGDKPPVEPPGKPTGEAPPEEPKDPLPPGSPIPPAPFPGPMKPPMDLPPTVMTPVPEPGSWALMLGGLLALGAVHRRRLRRA